MTARWFCISVGSTKKRPGCAGRFCRGHCGGNSDAIIAIVGGADPPAFGKDVAQWVRRSTVSSHIVMIGLADETQKLEAFADADVFVLPSEAENFGFAMFEAMASRVPVVVSGQPEPRSRSAPSRSWSDTAEEPNRLCGSHRVSPSGSCRTPGHGKQRISRWPTLTRGRLVVSG